MVERRIEELRDQLQVLSDPAGVLATLVANSSTAMAMYSPAGFCLRVNPAYREIFGHEPPPDRELSEDEVLGRGGVLFWVRRAFSGETIKTPTFWYEHPEPPRPGARRRVALSARAFPLLDHNGRLEFVAVTFRDETDSMLLAERHRSESEEPRRLIDEIHRADLERRTNEEQFRAVFEQCADGVMLTDDAGRVVDINPSGCRIFGKRVQDVIGSRYWEHIGDVASSRPLSERLIEEGQLTAEVQVRRADGTLRDLELRAVASFLPHRHLTTFLDVTERNQALHSLRSREAHLVACQRIAHVGSWEIDLPEQLADVGRSPLRASDECFRIFGVEPGSMELTPEITMSYVHPDDRTALTEEMVGAVRERRIYSFEHRIVRPDGIERHVHVRGEIVEDPRTGRPSRIIGTTQDITERVHAREQIQHLNEDLERRVADRTAQLEAANRDLEAFAYSVSHDLRAPLRAINGYAKILIDDGIDALAEPGRAALLRIEASARRMDSLIDGLLALSRLGRGLAEVREVDPRPIVDEALEEAGIHQGSQDIEILIGELPVCRADPALLRQVFVNLIGNAVKFSRDRQPARIEVGSAIEDGRRIWRVRDNGIGFDMRDAAQLFDVFHRLNPADSYEGSGVGLAIVERIVRLHGGRVWAESAPDHGAAFYFTF